MRALKYLLPVSLYFLAYLSFTQTGWVVWITLMYSWILIPVIELFFKPDDKNLSKASEELIAKDVTYDYLLYFFVIAQYVFLFLFLNSFYKSTLSNWDIAGRIATMGVLCGTFGINLGHELGHRKNKFEQLLAKSALMTSLYMHFFIEHNKGHHKHVATPKDPSSARLNEPVYAFYFRSIPLAYLSAWKIAMSDMKKAGHFALSWRNEMIHVHISQILFVFCIGYFWGLKTCLFFFLAAVIGVLLLETVNYVEHYGLQRKETTQGNFERAMPHHSWNSNHLIGRLMLFELSRHSDHHYLASKKYQVLKHHDDAPQLATGYPGSIMLALIPPIWFYIMNKKIMLLNKTA